jgi:hypothetical protein
MIKALDLDNALNCGKINKKNLEIGRALNPNQRRFDFLRKKLSSVLIIPSHDSFMYFI